MRKGLIVTLMVLGLALAMLVLNTARNSAGWQPIRDTPEAWRAQLEPPWRLLRPATPGPHQGDGVLQIAVDVVALVAATLLRQPRLAHGPDMVLGPRHRTHPAILSP